ncbi:hypothetical protein SB754_20715, partial [Leifsonia sp. SIMBA_070]
AIIEFERSIPDSLDAVLTELGDQDPPGIISVCTGFDESRAEGTELDYHHAIATRSPPPRASTPSMSRPDSGSFSNPPARFPNLCSNCG